MIEELPDIPFDEPLPYETRVFVHGVSAKSGERSQLEVNAPLPLFPPLPSAAPYPIDALGALAPAARAIVCKVQLPPSIAAQSVLAAAALAAQAHADVVLPYGQTRPLSLFFATVVGSGDRKSTADTEAMWPIAKRAQTLRDDYQIELTDWKINHTAWCAQKRAIENNKQLDLDGRRIALKNLGDEPQKPLAPFLTTDDLTLDELTKNWVSAHASLGVFTAEGGTFTSGHSMSDENRIRTAAALSKLWDGAVITRLRAADGPSILTGRRLSMHLLIQPTLSPEFLAHPGLRGQGLLSRVLVAAPESIAGTRFYRDPEPSDKSAIKAYGARILSILETPAPMAEGSKNELEPRAMPLSPDAATRWKKFFNSVEARSGDDGDFAQIRDFASKAAEHAARIAGVLTIVNDVRAQEIGVTAMENAVELTSWYLAEAGRMQSASRLDPKLVRAAKMLKWLRERGSDEIKFRDIQRLCPNDLRTKAVADETLAILKEHCSIFEVSSHPRVIRLNREPEAQTIIEDGLEGEI